jgi:hypothetical protein
LPRSNIQVFTQKRDSAREEFCPFFLCPIKTYCPKHLPLFRIAGIAGGYLLKYMHEALHFGTHRVAQIVFYCVDRNLWKNNSFENLLAKRPASVTIAASARSRAKGIAQW